MVTPTPSWNSVRLHGKWVNQDGSMKPGTWKLTMPVRVTNSTDDVIIPLGLIGSGSLNVSPGLPSLDIQAPCSDDPDNFPLGVQPVLEVTFADAPGERYVLDTPVALSGDANGIDLASVVLTDTLPIPAEVFIRGVAGGLAVLDSAGDVVDAAGAKVKGGGTALLVVPTVTASATLAGGKHTPVDATSGAKTMTLPTAAAGVMISVEKTDATTNAVTVSGTLRGSASTIPLTTQFEARTFLSEGSGSWRPVSDHRTKASLDAAFAGSILFTDPRIGGVGDGVTDNTAAWNAAMALLEPTGGELVFPRGVYCISGTTAAVPGGVLLRGMGINYGAPAGSATEGLTPSRGSVIRATAAMSRLIELGRNPTTSAQADTGASMQNLIVDGADLANTVVKTAGRRNYILQCQIYWGLVNAVNIAGQNSYVIGGVQAQNDKGDVILVSGYFDHKVLDAQQRQPGTTGACIRLANGVGDILIRGNHMWAGANGVPAAAEALIAIEGNAAVVGIVGNIIEGVLGPEIKINAASTTVQNINITGNQFFNNGTSPDATHPIISAVGAGAGAFISDVVIAGNIARGQGSGHRYKAVITYSGTFGGTNRWSVGDNSFFCTQFAVTGSASAVGLPKWINNTFFDGAATKYSDNSGEAVFSGDGTTTQFTITTNLIGSNSMTWVVTPSGAASAAPFYAFQNGANVTVAFTTAPPAGTNNVKLMWRAAAAA